MIDVSELIKYLESLTGKGVEEKVVSLDEHVDSLELPEVTRAVIKHLIVVEHETNGSVKGTVSMIDGLTEQQFKVVKENIISIQETGSYTNEGKEPEVYIYQTGVLAMYYHETGELKILGESIPLLSDLDDYSVDKFHGRIGVGRKINDRASKRILDRCGVEGYLTDYYEESIDGEDILRAANCK